MMKASGYGSLRRTGASKEAAEQKKKEKEERKMEAREEKEREKNEARQEKKEKKNAKAKDGDAKKNEGGGGGGNVLTRTISFKRTTSIKALLGLKGAGGEAVSPADPNKIVSAKLADDNDDEDEDEAEEDEDRKSEEVGRGGGQKMETLVAKTNEDHLSTKQKKGRTKSVGGEDDEARKSSHKSKNKKDKHLKTSASHSPSSQLINNAAGSSSTSTSTSTSPSSGYSPASSSSSSLYYSATTSTTSPLASSSAASTRGGGKKANNTNKGNSKKKRESWVGTISKVEKLLQADASPPSPDAAAAAKKGAHPVRIVVVGRACGKSCMIAHLTTGKFVKSPKPTTQDLVQHTVPLDGVQYDVSILEIGSSASAKKVFPKCFGWADCFMLVYSIADSKSFHELKKLYKEIMLVEDAASLPFCIVGTHSDLEGDAREVLTAEGRSLAHEWGGRPLVEISSKTGRNVDKAFDTLVREARDFGKDKGLAHPLHAHIERGQKWVEEKKAKKEMEIQRERLEHAKKAAGSAFALIGQRERRSVREGSLRGLAGGSPTNFTEAMTSSGSEVRSRLASDSGRLALNLNFASNGGSSSSSSHARPRGVDLVKECEGYVIEGGQCRSELLSPRTKLKRLAGSKRNKRWYREYFLHQNHTNWVGVDPKLGPVIVSILEEKGTSSSKSYNVRVVSRTKYGVKTKFLTKEDVGSAKMKTSKVLQLAEDGLNPDCMKKVKDPKLKEDLLKFEDESRVTRFKFGVLYQRAGQVREEDMFANQDPSPGFKKFLNYLGDEIELKGWDKYSGGLDTEGREGKNSIFMLRKDYEIMFHVSTYLPYSTKNDQQVERKKHIGNDVCVIVFQEDDQCVFTPTEITSDFNHVFMVVREEFDHSNDTHDFVGGGGGGSYSDSTTTTPSGKQHSRGKDKDKDKDKDTAEDRNSNSGYSGRNGGGSGVYDSNGYGSSGSGVRSPESGGGSGVRMVRSPSSRGGGGGVNNTGRTRYRVAITQKEGVPPYGPLIAYPPVYEAVMPRFRSILLKKLINAHNAAYEAPAFLTRRLKMREIALLDIAQKYVRVHAG